MSNGQTQGTQPKPSEPAAAKPVEEFEKLLNQPHRSVGVFGNPKEFVHAQRVAQLLVESKMMPEHMRGKENLSSAVIAVDIATRLNLSPQLVANQIYMVHERPAFSAQFMIAVMNTAADFGKVRYDMKEIGEKEITYSYTEGYGNQKQRKTSTVKIRDWQCTAWALEGEEKLPTGVNTLQKAKEAGLPILEGPSITCEMAIREGWWFKDGSKWPNMTQVMLRYRAAAFFGRLYAPELMMGLPTIEELEDMGPTNNGFAAPIFKSPDPATPAATTTASPAPQPALPAAATPPTTVDPPPPPAPTPPEAKTEPEKGSAGGFNPVKAVRGLCREAKLKEEVVIAFLIDMGSVPGNPASLEEVHLQNDKILTEVSNQWSDIVKRLKA